MPGVLPGMDAGVATCYTTDIPGSTPNWVQAQFVDGGRQHTSSAASQLGGTGFKGWTNQPTESDWQRTGRRNFVVGETRAYAEPVVQGGHNSYITRRAVGDDASAYRRTLRSLPDPGPQRIDRPEGKRWALEPNGPGPRGGEAGLGHGEFSARTDTGCELPQPGMGRLSRPVGIDGPRESGVETSYERAMGRKVRVEADGYHGSGRAGDMSGLFGAPKRPEDDATFFKSLKDTPTFIRFRDMLPPAPSVSPHVRRQQELRRNAVAEVDRDRELVAALALADPEEDGA
ncbi:hypothetical protein FOA52_008999 [Chlamydomonas sp. UWO 241]|nr:hypothetical protein FOA52_008999 [Chlamydomonas sp. UWO 241]